MLKPRERTPALSVQTVAGTRWTLAEQTPEHFTLVVFYRGLHCPICRAYLSELNRLHADFVERGVQMVVISSDSAERAAQAVTDWGLSNLTVCHSLQIEEARRWGLYVSTSRGKTSAGIEEPALFSEPGIFLIRADGTLYFVSVQSMPFARPHFDEMLKAIDFVLKNSYPARGEA
ncbi:MAG: peroxiredoxin-like family protein [Burkholderiaceae bacterium]